MKKAASIFAVCIMSVLLSGCGAQEGAPQDVTAAQSADIPVQETKEPEKDYEGYTGNWSVDGKSHEEILAEGEQRFPAELDGWGEVEFVSQGGGQAVFTLEKEGETVYALDPPESGGQFGEISEIAFEDYNGDGKTDIIMVCGFAGQENVPVLYARDEEGFVWDQQLTEFLQENSKNGSLASVQEGIADFSGFYSVCTSKSIWEVERFAGEVKELLLSQGWAALAEHIAYPITIGEAEYQDSAQFTEAFASRTVSPQFAEKLEQESCRFLFCNWQGIMLGNGEVWINEYPVRETGESELKVTAINGLEEE